MACTPITRREAGLRTAAVAALCGLALVQAIELPYNLAQERPIALLSALLLGGCLVLAAVLAAARADSGRSPWATLAALGAAVLASWAATRALALPGLQAGVGQWTSPRGLATAALGLALLGLGAAGSHVRPTLALARSALRAAALLAALAPAAGVLLVAIGPGPTDGERAIVEGARSHVHLHGGSGVATFRPGFGGHAGHYIYPNATAPQLPPWALALAVGLAALLTYAAGASLLRRTAAPVAPVAKPAPARPVDPASYPATTPARRAIQPANPAPARRVRGGVPNAPAALLVAATLGALSLFGASAPTASAHATLLDSQPPAASHVVHMPARARLTFSEPVQIVRADDVSVVDGRGRPVGVGEPVTDPRDPRVVTIGLRRGLGPDSYTVRYRVISADAHEVDDALVFALGDERLRAPVLRGAGGLSDTGPWAVAARFAELTALGLLLGLIAFRQLVWGPALRTSPDEEGRALAAGGRLYWRAFWVVAGAAGLAEAGVLAAKSAIIFHTGMAAALTDPQSAIRLVAASRFGDLLGWRSGLLITLVAIAVWEWARETSVPRATGRPLPAALMGGVAVAMLALLSAQGHASQAPLAPLSVAADTVHLAAAGVWIGGLGCLATVLLRAPAGPAPAVVRRFSRLALAAVGLIVVTGLARLGGELTRVSELWNTGYGRSILLKTALLAPLVVLGARNRRTLRRLPAGGAAAWRALRRNVRAELVIGLNIVLIAALLVAQLPGRDAPRSPLRSPPGAVAQTVRSPLPR